MTRALRFTKSEMANAAKLCREHGVQVKLDRDGSILVIPDNHRPWSIVTRSLSRKCSANATYRAIQALRS
jgi:hypothetical protein